ncbi:MAG: hypothetical protein EHM79_10335 [Geobacter sp.]|nr:MAG: hypothetical protein EHM79_10335 [Geobacter sp.]
MNVLYLVFEALLGGHVLSASTIAKEMKNSDVTPVFAGAEGALANEIRSYMPFEPVQIPLFHGTKQTYFTWASIPAIKRLREIVKVHNIQLIHAFDARSYMHAYPTGILEGIPVLCTLCGGIDPYYNLPAAPAIIVFSEEQKQKMVSTFGWPSERVAVVRTRLDLKQITSNDYRMTDEEAQAIGLDPNLQKVMMISSFDGTKIRSIHKVLDAAEMLFEKGFEFQLVMIGGKGELHAKAKARGETINQKFGSKRILMTGPVMKAFKLLQRAEIVLGVGRSAFEGMAFARPTLIVGENGFAGVVSPEEVGDIAWYNFSGRNQISDNSVEILTKEIGRLLADQNRRTALGEFGREYVFREIDVVRGANRIADIYQKMMDHEVRQLPLQQWLSFAKCLAPIAKDNGVHTLKQGVKKVFMLREASSEIGN